MDAPVAAPNERPDARTPVELGASGRFPDFIIIGAMKAATTSLAAYLDEHPQARCLGETHFFCCHFDRGPDWYQAQFAEVAGAGLVGEKTPHYLADPAAIDRIATLVPRTRLIAILRDPVDRALSHYWHARRRGREPRDLHDAFAAEINDEVRFGREFGYLERGRYIKQLKHVVERFPRSSLHVMLFEDLRDRPVEAFREVCRFLGLDPGVVPPAVGEAANRYREYRPEWLWRSMFRYRLWRFLPDRLAGGVGRWMTRNTEYPPLDRATREQLAQGFIEDNASLARWLDRDLDEWSWPRGL